MSHVSDEFASLDAFRDANPLKQYMIDPVTFKLNSGRTIDIPRCTYLFKRWEGEPIQDTYGGKALIDMDGELVFAELAILATLRKCGWDGVWADTYGKTFRRALPPDSCELPSHAQELYDRIRMANDGKDQWLLRCVRLAGQPLSICRVEASMEGCDSGYAAGMG